MMTGKHMLGRKLSDKTKEKMSERMKGKNNPAKRPEVRKKLSEQKKGDKNPCKRLDVRKILRKRKLKEWQEKDFTERNKKVSKALKGNKNAFRGRGNKWREENCERIRFLVKRRRALKKNADGSHTLGEWENLKAQYNWTCPCCKKSEPKIKLTEDHIIPLSKGGSDNIENIQPLCKSCNSKKYTKIIKYNYDRTKNN